MQQLKKNIIWFQTPSKNIISNINTKQTNTFDKHHNLEHILKKILHNFEFSYITNLTGKKLHTKKPAIFTTGKWGSKLL